MMMNEIKFNWLNFLDFKDIDNFYSYFQIKKRIEKI